MMNLVKKSQIRVSVLRVSSAKIWAFLCKDYVITIPVGNNVRNC